MADRDVRGRIDLAKFREVMKVQQVAARKGPEGQEITVRATIRLSEDQLEEARVGGYTILCGEAKERRGRGTGRPPFTPSPPPSASECSAS